MKREHRSALLALAARRGEKGFSSLVAEAVEQFLKGERERRQKHKIFASLCGSLTAEEAEDLRRRCTELRESWR
jgi:hypothetical protein